MKSLQMLSTRTAAGAARAAARNLRTQKIIRPISVLAASPYTTQSSPGIARIPRRTFSSSRASNISLTGNSPGSSGPTKESMSSNKEAASLSDAEYHELADQYLNSLVLAVEEAAESDAKKGLEVEYSAGVLTITHPQKGTYVINKQPPNKQIWLSSPESGPKRFDWVLTSSTSHDVMNSKQDTEGSVGAMGDDGNLGGGKWIYLRDGSGLSTILQGELEVEVTKADEADATTGREGPGGSGAGGGIGAAGGVEG